MSAPTSASVGTDRLPVAPGRQTTRAVVAALRPHRVAAVAAVVSFLASAAFGLLAPWALGRLVDDAVAGRGTGVLPSTLVLLVVSAVGSGVLVAVGTATLARASEPVLADLRERVVRRALRLRAVEVERTGAGDLLSRVGDDVTVVTTAIGTTVPLVVQAAATTVVTFGGIFGLDWRLGLAGLAGVPLYIAGARWYVRRSGPLYAQERVVLAERTQALVGSLEGARTLRAHGAYQRHADVVTERSAAARDVTLGVVRAVSLFGRFMNGAELVTLAAILLVGFWLVGAGATTVGAATAAAWFFHRMFGPLGILVSSVDDVQAAGASLARLVGVIGISLPPEPPDAGPPADTGLVVDGVVHAYDDGPVVVDAVSLRVAPGERVALVGASGAGKTTLASVVAGQLEPVAGTVRIGDLDLARLGHDQRQRLVAIVSQEVHVFAGSVADDVRLGRPDATDADVRAAVERVGAAGWVDALPDGAATVVGEGGHALTAVQAQQLALARLVLADPPVVVLDEATAESGSAGAGDLEASAEAAVAGRTALVVAHRLTQAHRADRVAVMEAGRIVEVGTHDELVAAGGRYAGLWAAWRP